MGVEKYTPRSAGLMASFTLYASSSTPLAGTSGYCQVEILATCPSSVADFHASVGAVSARSHSRWHITCGEQACVG